MKALKFVSLGCALSLLAVVSFGIITNAAISSSQWSHTNTDLGGAPTSQPAQSQASQSTTTASSTDDQSAGVPSSAPVPPPAPAAIPAQEGYSDAGLKVTSATLIPISTSTASSTTTTNNVIQLRGTAEPNIYITLYIYSTPIIVSVKTDSEGNWSYNIDKELENGQHTVYVAKVNNSGTVVAKSNPIFFTKTEASVALKSSDSVPVPTTNVNFFQTYFWWIMAFILVLIIILAITIVGMTAQSNEPHNPQDPPIPPTPGSVT